MATTLEKVTLAPKLKINEVEYVKRVDTMAAISGMS